jgi:hypothetical protein
MRKMTYLNMKTLLAFLILSGMVEMTVAQSQTTNAIPTTNAISATPEAAVVQMWINRLNAAKESPIVSSPSQNDKKGGKSEFTGANESSRRGGSGDSGGGFDSELKNIEQLAAKWTVSTNETDFAKVAEAVHVMAKERGITSKVTIETSRGGRALVKYQTEGERKRGVTPTTCKHLTKAVEEIQLGVCYIWSEREGKLTSNPHSKFSIAASEEQVEIQEVK